MQRRFDKAELPEEGEVSTMITVGANANALYDLYAELFGAESAGVRAMKYKKFKKLEKTLINGQERSRLILDAAPEKLYSVGIAAIVTKTLAKRFGAKDIIVSDHGVKEGYLRLILSGELIGAAYRYADEEETFFFEPASEDVSAEQEAESSEKEIKAEESPVGEPSLPAANKRHRGRPRKEKTEEELAAESAPKRHRGRPRKEKTEEEIAENAPRRHRGRPRKEKTEEEIAENAPKRHRGRPRKEQEKADEGENMHKETEQE